MTQPATLIEIHNLSKTFGVFFALRDVSFSVARGETLALLGSNGSGKTTLLRILAALSGPSGGRVTIGGWNLPKEARAVRPQLGFVGHQPLVYDDLSAAENLRFYLSLYGVPKDEVGARITTLLERVGLAKRAGDPARTFSRGMLQRLALARCMAHDPAVVLLDEPYTGLDVKGAQMLDGLLAEWRDAGKTIILTVHDIERAALTCQRAVILKQGRLAAQVDSAGMPDLPARFAEATA